MSRTTKIEKARVIHGRELPEFAEKASRSGLLVKNGVKRPEKPHKDVPIIEGSGKSHPGSDNNERLWRQGGIRYGNKRKAVAMEKVKERRAERKRNNREPM